MLDASHDLYGGGGLVSTVADVATFYRALFHGDVFDDPRTSRDDDAVSGAGRDDGAAIGLFAADVAGGALLRTSWLLGDRRDLLPATRPRVPRTINQADDRGFDYGHLERVVVDVAKRAVP